jgi:ATPase subunit of ABC transporter with duplicated ATPase domains
MPWSFLLPVAQEEVTMLSVERICKHFGGREVLRDITFHVGDQEKVGIVGANGCGKSTLLRIITGVETADSGSVSGDAVRTGLRYLPQGAAEQQFPAMAAGCMPVHGELWRLGQALSDETQRAPMEAITLLDAFDAAGSWPVFQEIEEVLRGLGVDYLDPKTPYEQLSGGERTKLGLADLLLAPGRLLLLDEPTNHLDLDALAWLERFLETFDGAALLVSHDRALLDAVVDGVVEIDAETHRARRYAGGYTAYQAECERERRRAAQAYRRQQERIEQIERDIRETKQAAKRFDTASANDHWRRIGKKVARTAKVRERRLERLLDSEEHLEKPKQAWRLKADMAEASRSGDLVLEARCLRLAFDARVLLDDCSLLVRQGERVLLTGPNGSGKTTLRQRTAGRERTARLPVAAGVHRPDAHAAGRDSSGSGDRRNGRAHVPAPLSLQRG